MYPPRTGFNPDWAPDGGTLIYEAFSSSSPDDDPKRGSRMRIYVLNRETGTTRQLIPNAVNPSKPDYGDFHVAWFRNWSGAGDWDY